MADEPVTEAQETPPTRPAVSTMAETPMAITQRGLDERAADAVPDAGTADWWEALGEDGQQIREAKKWEDPKELIKAYKAATSQLSKRDEARAELEAKIAQLEAQPQQPQPQQPNGGSPQTLDFDALAMQCMDHDTGDMNYGRMMELAVAIGARMAFDASEVRMNERFAQFDQERISPLAQREAEQQLAAELDEIQQLYGDDVFATLQSRVEQEMDSDADYLDRNGGARGAFAQMAFRLQQEQLRSQDAFTARGGGRRPQPRQMTPEEREVAAMEQYHRRPQDGL
jgi:hypothetical protein